MIFNHILNQITHDKAGKTKFYTSALTCEHVRTANGTCAAGKYEIPVHKDSLYKQFTWHCQKLK